MTSVLINIKMANEFNDLSIHDFTVMFNLSLRLLTEDLNHNQKHNVNAF